MKFNSGAYSNSLRVFETSLAYAGVQGRPTTWTLRPGLCLERPVSKGVVHNPASTHDSQMTGRPCKIKCLPVKPGDPSIHSGPAFHGVFRTNPLFLII